MKDKIKIKENEFDQFCNITNINQTQPPVGRKIKHYIERLKGSNVQQFKADLSGDDQMNRNEVRDFCRSTNTTVIDAYTIAMAWGGQRFDHFNMSISDASGTHLEKLLEKLRKSTASRAEDFAMCKEDCTKISGLGISFFTKLLYFFRPSKDVAYILDQWTAKSLDLLISNSPIKLSTVGMPHAKTTGEEYQLYCEYIEQLALLLSQKKEQSITGDMFEIALFDKSKGVWRTFVREQNFYNYMTDAAPIDDEDEEDNDTDLVLNKWKLAELIEKIHNEVWEKESDIPSIAKLGKNRDTVRITCARKDGICWQYSVNAKTVHAEIHFEKTAISEYDDYAANFGEKTLNFDGPVEGNTRDKNTATRKLRITTQIGKGARLDDIAEEAVEKMRELFSLLGERF